MPKTIIVEGKTSTEAIEKGLKDLKVSRNQVDVRILDEKKKSFFNILAPHMVKVEITVKNNLKSEKNENENKNLSNNNIEIVKENLIKFLDEFLGLISDEIKYNVSFVEGDMHIVISGNNSEKLIGYRGEALNSLQSILNNIANKNIDNKIKVLLDIGNYKDTRKKTLEELAEKVAKSVRKSGKSITLEPMTAYERKIIHTELQDKEDITTYSIGENDKRRIVISLK